MSGAALEVAKQRKKLLELRDKFAAKDAWGYVPTSLESIEWQKLHVTTRMLLLVFTGCDGELETLALRDWHELPQPERFALVVSVRRMRGELMGLVALARHA